jgi:hypothetical protein
VIAVLKSIPSNLDTDSHPRQIAHLYFKNYATISRQPFHNLPEMETSISASCNWQ